VQLTKFMPSGCVVEFDLICPKVREDDGDFGIFSISVKELIHCEGGGRWYWAVSALMGLQESNLLYGGSQAAPKLPSWGDAVFQSHRS